MEPLNPKYVRLPDSLWLKVKARAKSCGLTMQGAIALALREWLASK